MCCEVDLLSVAEQVLKCCPFPGRVDDTTLKLAQVVGDLCKSFSAIVVVAGTDIFNGLAPELGSSRILTAILKRN